MRRVAGDDQTAAWFLCLSGKCGLHRRRCLDQVNAYAQDAAEPWLDASAWQARGLARRRTADAFRDLQQAAIRFAAAGDLMHTSIVRYMLAHRAVEDGERLDEVPVWLADCESYAASNGYRHELAHIHLVRPVYDRRQGRPDAARELLDGALTVFRQAGDGRAGARTAQLLGRARRLTSSEMVVLVWRAD